MSKHNERGCPLPTEIIAKFRRKMTLESRVIFPTITPRQRREVVTERVLLYMDKYRFQTIFDDHLEEGVE